MGVLWDLPAAMTKTAILTYNVRGMGGEPGFLKFLVMLQTRKKKEKLGAICVQEHLLPEDNHQKWLEIAKIKGFSLIITYGRANDEESRKGGVLVLIDDSSLSVVQTLHSQPGFIMLELMWGGKLLTLANVYSPAAAIARIDFFNSIKTKISPNTIIGGDWNCVPDKTLDVQSANPLGYPNRGALLLATIMSDHNLVDERREQLGNEPEYTRKGPTPQGKVTSTRLDVWYTPVDLQYLQTYTVDNTYVFKNNPSDHQAVKLELDNQLGEIGHERQTINEDIIALPTIQSKIKNIVDAEYQGNSTQRKKWKRAMDKIGQLLFKETNIRKKKDKQEITRLQGLLQILNWRHKKKGATQNSLNLEKRYTRELFDLRHPETLREISLGESERIYNKSDVCSSDLGYFALRCRAFTRILRFVT